MALRWNDDDRTLALGIRDVAELGRRHIDRGGRALARAPLAMSRTGRMARGSALHRREQADRGDGFEAEVPLRWSVVVRGWTCTVAGRVDGLYEADGRTIVEELKSTALAADALDEVAGFPEWEDQLRLYVFFAAEARLPSPTGLLRVVSLHDGAQRVVPVPLDDGLRDVLVARIDRVVREREAYLHWQAVRRASPVVFAFPEWRPGQAEMAEAAEAAVTEGGQLLVTAPTGVGKTAAILYGVLRAAARDGLGVYWATARTTQQGPVERTLREMAARGTPLRGVTLRAREKVCLRTEGIDCRPEVCRHADGYRDRVGAPGVLDALAAIPVPEAIEVEGIARAGVVCPYELAVDHGLGCDVVIGDYNQCFDPDNQLTRLFGERRWVLVVDEAHQLPDRLMGTASPSLPVAVADAAAAALAEDPEVAVLHDLAVEIRDEILESGLRVAEVAAPVEGGSAGEVLVELSPARWADLRARVDEVALDHARWRADREGEDPWTTLAWAVHRFADTLARAGEETVAIWSSAGLRLVCRDPSPILGPRFGAAHAAVLLSATLAPTWFQRERCGLDPARVRELAVPSPFPPERRRVVVVPGVSTAWKDRETHRPKLADAIDRVVDALPGKNVAVFFPSYEALQAIAARLTVAHHDLLTQAQDASDEARAAVLAALREGDAGRPKLLLAVLGGVYAEGVDLPNDALSAVIVVGPALPPPSLERALLQDWYEQRFDAGFELAWIHPGMTRVVQAAGRVVRGATDRGLVVLLCRRFLRHEFAKFLPDEWSVEKSAKPWEVAAEWAGDPTA